MKLEKILLPELFLGKRGHPVLIRGFQRMQRGLVPLKPADGSGGIVLDEDVLFPQDKDILYRTPNLVGFFRMGQLFTQEGQAFYIPRDFCRALSQLDREIPVEYLPKRFCAWFQFSEDAGLQQEGTEPYEGALIFIGDPQETGAPSVNPPEGADRMISIALVRRMKDPALGPDDSTHWKVWLTPRKVSERLQNGPVVPAILATINATLYATSEDPEVMKLAPLPRVLSYSQRKHLERLGQTGEAPPVENYSTLPITVLNYAFKHGRTFSVDSTTVETHMRWQPCGPGRTRIKLIWVKEHERHYSKVAGVPSG